MRRVSKESLDVYGFLNVLIMLIHRFQAKGRKRQLGWFPASYVKVLSASGGSSRTTPVHMDGGEFDMKIPVSTAPPTETEIQAAFEAKNTSAGNTEHLNSYRYYPFEWWLYEWLKRNGHSKNRRDSNRCNLIYRDKGINDMNKSTLINMEIICNIIEAIT